jgi:hypothetical protein
MATDKNTLIGWFVKGAKPLATQFAAWLNSYWHKDEQIPVSSIEGLQDEFDKKADSELLTQEITDRQEADTQVSNTLSQQISDEATTRQQADEAEATARQNGDNNLAQTVSDLSAALTVVQNWKSAMTDADSDSVINTLTELLDLAKNVPEGADLAVLLAAKVSASDIVNNLTSVLTNVPLSAYQGNILKGLIDSLQNTLSTTYATKTQLTDAIAALPLVAGASYIFVPGNGTASANATALQNAYNTAKTMTPYGAALSATNRVKIICGAGTYTFASTFTLNTQYIDVVSLTGNADVMINGISVTANDVYVKGVNCETNVFTIANALNLLVCENCIATGSYSFGSSISASGTFINCKGGDYSFGSYGTASGTFTNCQGGFYSFGGFYINGGSNVASGIFTNCTSNGRCSFGYGGVASGTFISCQAVLDSSFGAGGGSSGTFKKCIAHGTSFGKGQSQSNSSGIFDECINYGDNGFGGSGYHTNCRSTGISNFSDTISGVPTASGTFINCIGGDSSFAGNSNGNVGVASGYFKNCEADSMSFGGIGTASGTFINCTSKGYSYGGGWNGSGIASGIFINCYSINTNTFGTYGTASGTFMNCVAKGATSFGYGSTVSGVFVNCSASGSSFGNYSTSGNNTGIFKNCLNNGDYGFGGSGYYYGCTNTGKGGFIDSIGGVKTSAGTYIDCSGGDFNFADSYNAGYGNATGVFKNCHSGQGSFGSAGTASGTFIKCHSTGYSFGNHWANGAGNVASGVFIDCICDSQQAFGASGVASGTFTNCIGGHASCFGGNSGTLTGKLYFCRLTTGTFNAPTSGGKLTLCIDGNNAIQTT